MVRAFKMNKLIFILCSLFIVLSLGCGSRDYKLEKDFAKKVRESLDSGVESLDLRTVFGDEWEKICFQIPCQPQDHFKKVLEKK